MEVWLKELNPELCQLKLYVQAGAKDDKIVGLYQGCLKVRIACAPVDGKANLHIRDFFAELLGISKQKVHITSGLFAKRKLLVLELGMHAVEAKLLCKI